MPLRDRSTPAAHARGTRRRRRRSPRRTTRSRRRRGTPRRRPAPSARDRGSSSTPGARRPRSGSAVSTTMLSIRSSTSSPATGPVRSFGPGRSTSTPTDAVERRGRGARGRRLLGVHVGCAVRGVEPHDVDARVEQRLQRVGLRRRRSDRRHDLGSPHSDTSRLPVSHRPIAGRREPVGYGPPVASVCGPHPRLRPAGDGRARRAARGAGARRSRSGSISSCSSTSRRPARATRSPTPSTTERCATRCAGSSRRSTTSCSSGSRRASPRSAAPIPGSGRRRGGAQAGAAGARPSSTHVGVRIER